MKKLIVLIAIILATALQATPQDSTKIANLETQIKELQDRNKTIETIFVDLYLNNTKKELGSAFMDFYLANGQLSAMNENARNLIIEITKAKDINDVDKVLKKYDLERK